MQFNFTIIYLVSAVIASLFLCAYAWRSPQARGTKAYGIACFMSVLWMCGDIIGRLSATMSGQWFGEVIRFLGGMFVPVALLVFIFQYCGKHITRRWIALLCIIPAVSWVMLLTNPWHWLFFSKITLGEMDSLRVEYGYYFWFVHLPYSYGLSLIGFATVILEINRSSKDYRKQISILFLALCVPFAINIIGVFKMFGEFSYTALSFPISFSIMAIAIFRYRLLGSNPIAYETVFQTIRDGVIILDRRNIIMDINPAAAKGLNKKPSEIIGLSFEEAFAPWENLLGKYKDATNLYDEIELDIAGNQHHISINITSLKNANGGVNGRILTLRDITDRKEHLFSLETLAFHDPLTRLANRHKFQEEVEQALIKAQETKESFAVLYLDLNRFKQVNDTMGHAVGDELLKYVAARISSVLRKPDVLARLGGDEFAALLHNCDQEGINIVVKRILHNIQRPFKVGDHTLVAELSIGAAFYPEDGKTLTELLRHADSAMYQAKHKGGGLALLDTEINVSDEINM